MNASFYQKFFDEWRRSFLIIGILFFLFFVCYQLIGLYTRARGLEKQAESQQSELTQIQIERKKIEADIEFLKSQSAIEREAKANLNYKKPGEEVIIVVPSQHSFSLENHNNESMKSSIFMKIGNFFKQLLGF